MSYIVAIQPDDYTAPGMPPGSDASSPRWASLLTRAGCEVKWVDVHRADILDQARGCDGFMWRWAHFDGMFRIARRLLPVLEHSLGLVVYPDQSTCWHYDDKVAQAYLFQALGIPHPQTWVWHGREAALVWAREATYPVVLKLPGGAGSSNVRLVRTFDEAERWISRMFRRGLFSLDDAPAPRLPWSRQRLRSSLKLLLKGLRPATPALPNAEYHRGLILFQEFLPGNACDYRITVIGNRAFGFRRRNRVDDFRASGSGNIDVTPSAIDERFIRLAFGAARSLQSQSCAVDGLWKAGVPVLAEASYTYVSWAVHECPGHWELLGEPEDGELQWVVGQMWPEEAQVADLLHRLRHRAR